MAKRFTDTDKWKKKFLRSMEAPYKLLFLYILDDCDHAGIWHVDIDVASIRIGEEILEETAIKYFADRIIIFDGGEKWFIPDFIEFQYGELNPKNRVHKSVLDQIEKYKNKGLVSPLQGAKDKDIYKDKDKDKEKESIAREKKFSIHEAFEICQKDTFWVNGLKERRTKNFDADFEEFYLLEKDRGVTEVNIKDWKSHFVNWIQSKRKSGGDDKLKNPMKSMYKTLN